MKLVVLAAGNSSTLAGLNESPPVCLNRFDKSEVVLDTLVAIGQQVQSSKYVVVGGYRLTDIMQARPGLAYYYNRDWKESGVLASLLQCAHEFDDDLLIAYSDVVHHRETAVAMIEAEGEIVVACDSLWKTRYEGRTARQRGRAEVFIKTALGSNRIVRAAQLNLGGGTATIVGEYAGLILLRKNVVRELAGTIGALVNNDKNAGIDSLLAALDTQRTIAIYDLKGNWAELDAEADLASFRFGTKAETLTRLENVLLSCRVLPQFTFTVRDWMDRRDDVLQGISRKFAENNRIVVRSSAINEDTELESMAGNFDSVLHVPIDDRQAVISAIARVCQSYQKNGTLVTLDNQVLIQPMLDEVHASGVVFTSDLETAAPYFTIAIDRSGSTDSVTSGTGKHVETIIVARDAKVSWKDRHVEALIVAIKEIEQQTGYTSLDIEFAITDDSKGAAKVVVLQVRPIAAHKEQKKVASSDIDAELQAISRFIRSDNCQKIPLCGTETAYGVMPDWNPAEIIGINPRPLAFSLYRHLITDRVWGQSRELCGYRTTFPRPGLVSLSGKPYVDVRMSFSSFVPASLEDSIAERLVEFAVRKLKANPELHDKVEFDVMPTVFDLGFSDKLSEWKEAGFSESECRAIHDVYHTMTLDLVSKDRVDAEVAQLSELANRRKRVLDQKTSEKANLIESIRQLLQDCQDYGTLPFSNLARLAFVGITQLKSLVNTGVMTSARYHEFLASINTVAKHFVNDLANGTKPDLLKAYGHLRPGTYDIRSLAYHEAFDDYIDLENRPVAESLPQFELSASENAAIIAKLDAASFKIDSGQLLEFIRAAVQGRELGKFEFSRNLSLAIDFIAELGEESGLNREELSFLEVDDILEFAFRTIPANHGIWWRELIELRRRQHAITCAIKLPELITRERNIWSFSPGMTKPNFVTQKTVFGATVNVKGAAASSLDGTLCLIENADPGFDWIFSHRIAGLITAFGGANSHMAIRCAEFEVPAAIGCGEILYRQLLMANRIRLDCVANTIEVLS